MADHYAELTDTEKAYWDIYTRLRELSDWPSFTDGQAQIKDASRAWLIAQRKEIWRVAQPAPDGDGKGWGVYDRNERYEQLKDENLNSGSCRRVTSLPCNGMTDTELVKIKERCMWWQVSSVDEATKEWRSNNAGWLTNRRKEVWHLGQDEGWNESNRELRYDNLCVATKTGQAYTDWAADHDPVTGQENGVPAGSTSSRGRAVENCRKYLGVSESPPSSNRGSPQPDGWENRVYGSSGVPWCACFSTCMAWDSGVTGAGSAGVSVIMSMAQQHQGMFRGWTTNPAEVMRGDMAVIGCSSCHVGMVVDSDDACHTIEGNTSPGSEGSQYNGGCVAEKHRARSEIVGWALVDYP